MSDPRDYKLDIRGLSTGKDTGTTPTPRPFLSVKFACCNVYQRIYKSADGQSYRGHCPKCARPVHFKIGPGGSDARCFIVE